MAAGGSVLRVGLVLLVLVALCSAAEWKVLAPNVMTVAIGVSAADNDTIYVSGGDNGGGAAILKSSDGGSTWATLPRDAQAMYLSIDVALGSTLAVAGSLGFWKQTALASYSVDGESFLGLPFVPLFSATQSVTAVSPQSFYLISSWMASVISDFLDGVVSSVDGGKTLNFFPWSGGTQARYGDFPSATTWYVSGGSWPAKSGRDKNVVQLNSRIQIHHSEDDSVSFTFSDVDRSNKNGYIGVLQKTTDGGKTFQTVFNDTNRFYFNGIDCTDENTCWVVAEGPDGAWIFRTSDGGKSWVEQIFLAGDSLIEIQMLNELEGWAVGGEILANTFNALFLHTLDGGKTWENTNTVPNAYPNSITVPSSGRAYATAFLRNGLSSILGYN